MNQLTVSLWGDEAWAATLIGKSIPQIISLVPHDTSPPLYYLLAHLWTSVFGLSEIALRSLSTFFWLLTAVFAALIARHFWQRRLITFFAFAFTLLNPFLFQYAFEARMYAILALMSTAATYFFLTQKWKFYILFAVLSLYSHHFSLFVIFWHFLWTLLHRRPIKPFIFVGLFYLPWLPVMYSQTKMVTTNGFWLSRPILRDIPEVILIFIVGTVKNPLQNFAVLFAVFALVFKRYSLKDQSLKFLLSWLFVPIFVVYLFSQIIQPIFYDRYLINLAPAFALLLLGPTRNWRLHYLFLSLLLITLFLIDAKFFLTPTKLPFRDLAAYIKTHRYPQEILVNWNSSSHHLFESKYYQIPAPIYTPGGSLPFYTGTALMESGDQITTLPFSPILGVITSGSLSDVNLPDYQLISQKSFSGLNYSQWLKN